MALNKSKIIISILKTKNDIDFLKSRDNLFITVLLLDKYECIFDDEAMKLIGTNRKIKKYLQEAQEKLLINKNFRKKYLSMEEKFKFTI